MSPLSDETDPSSAPTLAVTTGFFFFVSEDPVALLFSTFTFLYLMFGSVSLVRLIPELPGVET